MNRSNYFIISFCLFLFLCLNNCKNKTPYNLETETLISEDSLEYDTAPRWSKKGDRILFYTYRHDKEGAELYTVFPDGTNLTRVTNTYHNEWWSDFSVNDSIIYISSDYGKSERFSGSEIYMLSDNANFIRVTNSQDSTSFNIHPRVSPDGSQLLYCYNCIGKDVNSEIHMISLSSIKDSINLSNNSAIDRYASWSPNGKQILFESNRSGNFELYTIDLTTRKTTQLTSNNYDDIHGDWSKNNEIVFVSNRDGDEELFIMNSDGSHQRQITFNDVKDVLPSWSPDGKRIAYSSYRFGKKDKGDIFIINKNGSNDLRLTKK